MTKNLINEIDELLGNDTLEDVIKQNIVDGGKDYFDKIMSDVIYKNLNGVN